MTTVDPNIILVNVLATIGVVKGILWLLDNEEGEYRAPDNNKSNHKKIKPLRISKRILGMLSDEEDDEDKKDKTEKEEEKHPIPRWIKIIQEKEGLPAGHKAEEVRTTRSLQGEDGDEVSEVYLYAICICVSIILSVIILR